uniref:Uncharacterized protein n=1 Tax=Arundo donax TaxID=35708 RepID=A0A0A9GME3_ARUDO
MLHKTFRRQIRQNQSIDHASLRLRLLHHLHRCYPLPGVSIYAISLSHHISTHDPISPTTLLTSTPQIRSKNATLILELNTLVGMAILLLLPSLLTTKRYGIQI